MTQSQQGEDGDGVAARRCDNCDTALHLLAPGPCFLLWCTVSLISHSPLHFSLLVVTTLTTVYHHLQPQCLFNSTAFVFMKFLIDKAKSPMISW